MLMGVEKLRKQEMPQEDEEMDPIFDLRSQDFEIQDNDKLFVERSKNSRSFRLLNDFGIGPCKLLSAKDIKFST
ncbi:hypothetical protein AgCh_001694 [Apium graveolens]